MKNKILIPIMIAWIGSPALAKKVEHKLPDNILKVNIYDKDMSEQTAIQVDLSSRFRGSVSEQSCYYITADHGLKSKNVGDGGIYLSGAMGTSFPVDIVGRDWATDVALLKSESKFCKQKDAAKFVASSNLKIKTRLYSGGYLSEDKGLRYDDSTILEYGTTRIPRPMIEHEIVLERVDGKGVSGGAVALDKEGKQLVGMLSHQVLSVDQDELARVLMLAVGSEDILDGLNHILSPFKTRDFVYNYPAETVKYGGIELESPLIKPVTILRAHDPHGTSGDGSYGVRIIRLEKEYPYLNSSNFDQSKVSKIYSLLVKGKTSLQTLSSAAEYIRLAMAGTVEAVEISHFFSLNPNANRNGLELIEKLKEQLGTSSATKSTDYVSVISKMNLLEQILISGNLELLKSFLENDLETVENLVFLSIDTLEHPEFLDLSLLLTELVDMQGSEK